MQVGLLRSESCDRALHCRFRACTERGFPLLHCRGSFPSSPRARHFLTHHTPLAALGLYQRSLLHTILLINTFCFDFHDLCITGLPFSCLDSPFPASQHTIQNPRRSAVMTEGMQYKEKTF